MTRRPLMLIVEDAEEVADIIQIAFRNTEIEIHYRNSGHSALDFLESRTPDVIILDIGMPDMSGWDFLEIMKKDITQRDIPVIILTAYNDSTNRKIASANGVSAFLKKPIDLNELRGAVDKAIYLHR